MDFIQSAGALGGVVLFACAKLEGIFNFDGTAIPGLLEFPGTDFFGEAGFNFVIFKRWVFDHDVLDGSIGRDVPLERDFADQSFAFGDSVLIAFADAICMIFDDSRNDIFVKIMASLYRFWT